MKLKYSKLAYSAMMALAAVLVGALVVLAVVGLIALVVNYPILGLITIVGIIFAALWADAYDHINY